MHIVPSVNDAWWIMSAEISNNIIAHHFLSYLLRSSLLSVLTSFNWNFRPFHIYCFIDACTLTSNCCSRDLPFLLISLMRVKTAIFISCSTFLCVSATSLILKEKKGTKDIKKSSVFHETINWYNSAKHSIMSSYFSLIKKKQDLEDLAIKFECH